jgi:hypothetical protein
MPHSRARGRTHRGSQRRPASSLPRLRRSEPRVRQADIVATKRLGTMLAQIQRDPQKRDRQRLASRNLTLRQKARIRASRKRAEAEASSQAAG